MSLIEPSIMYPMLPGLFIVKGKETHYRGIGCAG